MEKFNSFHQCETRLGFIFFCTQMNYFKIKLLLLQMNRIYQRKAEEEKNGMFKKKKKTTTVFDFKGNIFPLR